MVSFRHGGSFAPFEVFGLTTVTHVRHSVSSICLHDAVILVVRRDTLSCWAMIQKLKTDFVIEEIHRTRREISERSDGNIIAVAGDAARRQAASGRRVWQGKDAERINAPDPNRRSELS